MVKSCTCGGRSMDKNFLLWHVKLLWRFEPCLSIYLCMVAYYAYLSTYDYVMYLWLCLVDSCSCNLVSIHIVSLSYHLITLVLLCTPHFEKLYKRAFTYLLVWIMCLFNPCISLGGRLLYKIWKTKLYYAYLLMNSKCCHQSPKRGRLEVHLGPLVGFRGLMTNN
jgi:hypothetical protein